MMTEEEIEAGRSANGGFTKAQLLMWGVPYPPPKGWKQTLMSGGSFEEREEEIETPSPIRPDMDAHDLLREVVTAVVNAGYASDLYDHPDVLAYFGAQIPPDMPPYQMGFFDPEPEVAS